MGVVAVIRSRRGGRGGRGGRGVPVTVGAVVVVAAVVASACSGGAGSRRGVREAPATREEALAYGYGPAPVPDVPYQPDVVFVEAGPRAIRGASADGLVWALARSAKGVSELRRGSVLVATSRATGRVAAVRDEGDTRIVTLAPVDLDEIVRDGTVRVDRAVDLGDLVLQEIPALPFESDRPVDGSDRALGAPTGSSSVSPPDGDPTVRIPTMRLAAIPAGPAGPRPVSGGPAGPDPGSVGPELPPPKLPDRRHANALTLRGWIVTPYAERGKFGLNLAYRTVSALKVGIDVAFLAKKIHLDARYGVKDGEPVDPRAGKRHSNARSAAASTGYEGSRSPAPAPSGAGPRFTVRDIAGIALDLQAGAANGSSDNTRVTMELPVELNVPIPPSPMSLGLPLNVKVTFKFTVVTAIGGRNSTIKAHGEWNLGGDWGFRDGRAVAPAFSVKKSIVNSITGVSLAPTGMVVGVKTQLMAGIGTHLGMAGPFSTFTVTAGVTNGSALGASLTRCASASLDLFVGGGVGVVLNSAAGAVLQKVLPAGTQLNSSIEMNWKILHREQTVPPVPVCSATAGTT